MKKKNNNSKTSLVVGICILFVFIFIILVAKQKENNLGDVVSSRLNIPSIPNKQVVIEDLDAIHPKYYVLYYDNTDNSYIIHGFNFYQTDSQYELERRRLLDSIIDYNYSEYMIRYLYDSGHGSYNEIISQLRSIVQSNNIKVY